MRTFGSIVALAVVSAVLVYAAKRFPLTAASIVPTAKGSVEVGKDRNGNTDVKLKVERLANPTSLSPSLIEDGTHPPESLVVGTEPYSAGWSSIMGSTSAQLGKEIENAGWTFFYMANETRTSGFGFNDQFRTARAVAHLIVP